MYKFNKKLAYLVCSTCLTGLAQAGNFDDSFKNATTSGQFRFGYISVKPDAKGEATTTGAAFGGEVKFETAKWNQLQFSVAPFFVEKISHFTGDTKKGKLNGDYFNSSNNGYAYLGEAYINYSFKHGSVRLGRQKLDNPFINTDEIRMFANTFNAAWLNLALSESLKLEAGKVNAWAGFDSGNSQEQYKKASKDGVIAIGINYTQSDALSMQAWHYSFDDSYTLAYADITYITGPFELGAQYGRYSEINDSGTDGSVIGISAAYTAGPFTLAAAMNSGTNDDGKSASLGLGGGNFYAAMDESTINELNDASARVYSLEYAAANNLTASIAVGHFEDSTKVTNTDETNLALGYDVSDTLNIEFVHTILKNKGTPADDFSRQTARITYTF